MNSLSSIAQSGMSAALLRLDVAANNVANLGTPNYRRQSVVQEARSDGGVGAAVSQAGTAGDDLAADIVQQMIASTSFKANLRVFQAQDGMLGSLLDLHA